MEWAILFAIIGYSIWYFASSEGKAQQSEDAARAERKRRAKMAPYNHIACPTCGRSEVEKISIAKKGAAGVAVGVLAAGYVAKTFKCRACNFTW